MIERKQCDWIVGLGGPLVIIECGKREKWLGSPPDADFEADTPPEPHDHYAIASRITEYAAAVDVTGATAIVLWGGDFASAWIPFENPRSPGAILRWGAADSEEQILQALRTLSETEWQLTVEAFEVASDLILFDSAFAGNSCEETISICLPPAVYRIETADFESEDVWLVAHRFVRRG